MLIVVAGLLSLAISTVHGYQSIEIWTRHALDVEGVAEARDAMRAVAAINLTLQSLPVLPGVSLLRHPSVARFCEESRTGIANA